MPDFIPSQDVLTQIRIGGFTINVYAYRVLTRSECLFAKQKCLEQLKRKSFPKNGSVKMYFNFGNNPLDNF